MNYLKCFLTSLLVGGLTAQNAIAQEDVSSKNKKEDFPHVFIGVRGGGQVTYTNFWNSKLITPIAGVDVGGMFTPAMGARLNLSGINCRGGLNSLNKVYCFNFVTTNLDMMLNLCEAIAPKRNHTLNAYLIGGVGLTYAWDNDNLNAMVSSATDPNLNFRWEKDQLVHNFRVGVQLEAEVARNVAANFEVTANNLGDRFNSKMSGRGDWQVQMMLGLNFKFGFKKKAAAPVIVTPVIPVVEEEKKVEPVVEPVPAPAPVPAPVVQPKEEKKEEVVEKKIERTRAEVFFVINSSTPSRKQELKVKELADWLKTHPEAKVSLTGYADAGTGTAAVNRRVSERRVKSIARLLINKYGIEPSRISTDFKGDTVQPFRENNANRVVIGIGVDEQN